MNPVKLAGVVLALATHFWDLAGVPLILLPLQICNAGEEHKLLQEKVSETYLACEANTWF